MTAVVTAVTVLAPGPAQAQSVKAQIGSAEQQLHQLEGQAQAATERYDAARIKLDGAQQTSDAAQRQLAQAQARVARLQRSVAQFAAAAYRGQLSNPLFGIAGSGSAATFLNQMSAMQAVSVSQSETLAEMAAATRTEQQAQADADAALGAARQATAAMQADRDQILAAATKERKILAGLQVRERAIIRTARARAARLAAQRRAAQLQAQQQATTQAARAVVSQPVSTPPVTGSGGAAVAVAWARRELGKPYVWGAAGPNSFDCSGLTMYVWAKAGVQLAHYTVAQFHEGTPVSRSQLAPGDLVFFAGSDGSTAAPGHVGLYIGGGEMIEAPYTGADVRISSYNRPDYAGAVRPG